MLTHQIALVSKTRHIKSSELSKVAAALQKQATRDLGPIWGIQATVDDFEFLKDVPGGYWPIIIKDNIHESGPRVITQINISSLLLLCSSMKAGR
jgi:hypothetical protein